MSKALARRPSQHNLSARAREHLLAEMLSEVAAEDVHLLRAAGRASELDSAEQATALLSLPRSELEAQGWTREELRVARDARSNSREVPFYVKMAHERTLMRYRGNDGAPPAAEALIVLPDSAPEADQQQRVIEPPRDPDANNG